jgi:hypothetical protein
MDDVLSFIYKKTLKCRKNFRIRVILKPGEMIQSIDGLNRKSRDSLRLGSLGKVDNLGNSSSYYASGTMETRFQGGDQQTIFQIG